jgi:hypothetical protein
LFLSDNNLDVAGTASPEGDPLFAGEVPVLDGDGLEHTAHPTWLPPASVAEDATRVQPLVCKGIDQFEV